MIVRSSARLPLIVGLALLASASPVSAQGRGAERFIRRDIPMTNTIQRAMAAGTRDSTGRPGPRYWQLQTDYSIDVRLDVPSLSLVGDETITLHNNSPDPLTRIVLRLDHNIFLPRVPRNAPSVPAETTDGMVVTSMSVNGAPVNLQAGGGGGRGRGGGGAEVRAANLDQTSASITLPTPIAPGARGTVQIAWRTKLPGGPGRGHRMTQRWGDTLFQPTQWYPRIAKYDDLRGWDTELYLGPSEFYNNFGRFDVRIDVPAGWLVGATGILQNPDQVLSATTRQRLSTVTASASPVTIVGPGEGGAGRATAAGDRLVWRFVADTVNDFAWGTSSSYLWSAARANIPGRGNIPVNMFYLPGNAGDFARSPRITPHALEFYSRLWIPYSWGSFTMLDGPSDGMEYPMLINSSDGPADHEVGHQWWPMTLGTNETQYGWMDEGFNQYMNILSDADADSTAPDLDGHGQSYGRISGSETEAPLMWSANSAGSGYSFQAYSKTPLMLSMLGGIVGDSAVHRGIREYATAWRFKHPSPWDFMFSMNRTLGRDLGWFWYYWLFTTERVDGSIQGVQVTGTQNAVMVRQDGQMPSPVVLRVHLAQSGAPIRNMPNARMIDELTYDVSWPVDVWFNGSRTFTANVDFGRAIERIELDPRRRFPDSNTSDNSWPR